MKALLTLFLLFSGCSSHKVEEPLDQILILQSVWVSKDINLAQEKIKGLHKVQQEAEYEVYGLEDKIKIFSLTINVSKKDKKIISMGAPVNNGEEIASDLIKRKLKASDWQTYEHPVRGTDYLEFDITEYSESLGAGFAYDKHDKLKATRMIVNP